MSEEQLDRAAAALRDAEAGDPPPQLNARTVAALRRADRGPASFGMRIAAAVVIAGGAAALYLALRPAPPKVVQAPPVAPPATQRETVVAPKENPQTAPAPIEPERRVVKNVSPMPPPPREQPPRERPTTPVLAAGDWSITGTVRFDGDAPEPQQIDMSPVRECAAQHPDGVFDEGLVVHNGRLANVVVYVKPAAGQALPQARPTRPAVLDQRGCQYHPHVLAVQVGQQIAVTNNDNFLHNVHALSLDNPAFNFGQPTKDPQGRKVEPMRAPEVFKVKCDLHPWMGAVVYVVEHPFFAVTKEDGTYTIPVGLPDGQYTLVAWQEKLGERQAVVDVKDGKAEGADIVFRAQ
jgi:plastocyanin